MQRSTNPFLSLSRWFPCGREDFFTAALAHVLSLPGPQRAEFVGAIGRLASEERLVPSEWVEVSVDAQVSVQTERYGKPILDMVLVGPRDELWCEHKIGSAGSAPTAKASPWAKSKPTVTRPRFTTRGPGGGFGSRSSPGTDGESETTSAW